MNRSFFSHIPSAEIQTDGFMPVYWRSGALGGGNDLEIGLVIVGLSPCCVCCVQVRLFEPLLHYNQDTFVLYKSQSFTFSFRNLGLSVFVSTSVTVFVIVPEDLNAPSAFLPHFPR